ncbi:YidC/Oxa1 family membrane protein insertase, partial [Bacillus sp. D-CC]
GQIPSRQAARAAGIPWEVQTETVNKEMSELMKSGGWNPLAGCWPLLIQMPIFSALYYAISRTEEIRTSSFLWVNLGHADPYHILPYFFFSFCNSGCIFFIFAWLRYCETAN